MRDPNEAALFSCCCPFYPAWSGGGGRAAGRGGSRPSLGSLFNGPVCVCLPRLKCHEAAAAFDPALMSPQYVSLSWSRAPLHIPLMLHRPPRNGDTHQRCGASALAQRRELTCSNPAVM